MFGIVIVAHAGLADEYLSAMEHVVGKQPQTLAIPISAECDRDAKQKDILAAVNNVDQGDGVVLVTDLYGGTPSNLALKACDNPKRRVLYGANLPLLLKLATLRNKPINDAIEEAITAARKYINCTDAVASG